MKIPYGQSDFADLRRRGMFYVDKTPLLAQLESDEGGSKYLLFLRPRRFGKSLLLSTLAHYYDMTRADRFDELFGGLQTMHRPEQLVSLFYYMGMLTFLPQPEGTVLPRLCVPNRVIRELQWEYLALKAGALVFVGGKQVVFRPWPPPPDAPPRTPRKASKRPGARTAPKKPPRPRR